MDSRHGEGDSACSSSGHDGGAGHGVGALIETTDDMYYCLNCKAIINCTMDKSSPCTNFFHQIITWEDYQLKQEFDKRNKAHEPLLFFGQELKVGDCAINCDASLRKCQKVIGCGIVVRTYNLAFVYAETQIIQSTRFRPIDFERCTSTTAEIKALYRALEVAYSYHIKPTTRSGHTWNRYVIYSDSSNAVNAFNYGELAYRENDEHREISLDLINTCRVLAGLNKWNTGRPKGAREGIEIREDNLVLVKYIERELNSAADFFSKRQLEWKLQQEERTFEDLPYEVKIILFDEKIMQIRRLRYVDLKGQDSLEEHLLTKEKQKEKLNKKSISGEDYRRPLGDQFKGLHRVPPKLSETLTKDSDNQEINDKTDRQKQKQREKAQVSRNNKLLKETLFYVPPSRRRK